MSEEILGIMPALLQEGQGSRWVSGRACTLVFTTSRLIVTAGNRSNVLFWPAPDYLFSKASTRDRLRMKEQSGERILALSGIIVEIKYEDIQVAEFGKPVFDNWTLRVFTENLNVPAYNITISPRNYTQYVEDFAHFFHAVLPGKI